MQKVSHESAPTSSDRVDGRSQGKRQLESERKRQRILDAAQRCFGELGFAAAKVETIAAEAGVSNGLLYQFFRGKEQLFEVVVEELIRDWAHTMFPRTGDPPESCAAALEAMLRNSVEFCRTHPLLPRLLTADAVLELERFSDVATRRLEAQRTHVAGILERGVRSGEFRADLDLASAADIISQLHADYAARAYRRRPEYPMTPELLDALVRFVHDALRA